MLQRQTIECGALTKRYGRARGVTGLDLTVAPGEFFGFIGPNGAGKSTTIRAMLGLLAPTSGRVRVLGLDPQNRRQRTELLCRVGYLPGETQFYPDMRVSETIALSARLRGRDCRARAAELCERLSLDPTRRIEQLSLGNRKKVGIVCALQHDPELFVLDEPTSGLDPLVQQTFFELLEERHREGATIFFSSHVLTEVQRHCTRAAVLREGKLAACGSVAELAGTAARRVTLLLGGEGGTAVDAVLALPGVSKPERRPGGVTFLYGGAPGALLAALGALGTDVLRDVTIAEPSLEDVFLHYYSEQGGEQG